MSYWEIQWLRLLRPTTGKRAPARKTRGYRPGHYSAGERQASSLPLHQLSTSGGVLQLENPLDEKIKVEVIFHVGSSTVRSQAVTLFPMWATKGCLQPFGFCDLPEKDKLRLQADLQQFLDQAATAGPASPTAISDTI